MADLIASMFGAWTYIAAGAFMIVTILVAIVYALGSALLNEKMKTWAKMELIEIFYSVIILVLAISSIPLVDAVVQGAISVSGTDDFTYLRDPGAGMPVETPVHICQGDAIAEWEHSVYHNISSCHIRLAIFYLREVFIEAKEFAYSVFISYMWTAVAAEFSINVETIWERSGFVTWNPIRGFFTMGNVMKELAFDWAMKIMMLTKFQEIFVRFFATAAFAPMFVAGTILRTFTFTRRLGGLLMGVAITLYFIFPAFYAFGALVMLDLKEQARGEWLLDEDANPHHSKNPPIANSLYSTGTVSMFGGDITTEELNEELFKLEEMEMDEEEIDRFYREGNLIPLGDLGDLSHKDDSETSKLAQYVETQKKFYGWFLDISGKNWYDKFLPRYWKANGLLETLARLTFFSLFFSLFGIIGAIAAVRSISMTLGGDLEIAGLTRLI